MSKCLIRFNEIAIINQKSDSEHSDNDWLCLVWTINDEVFSKTLPLVNTQNSKVIHSGDKIGPLEHEIICNNTDVVTVTYSIINLSAYEDWGEQAKQAARFTQEIVNVIGPYYMKAAVAVLGSVGTVLTGGALAVAAAGAFTFLFAKFPDEIMGYINQAFDDVLTPYLTEVAQLLEAILGGRPNCNGLVLNDTIVFMPDQPQIRQNLTKTYDGPQTNSNCGHRPRTQVNLSFHRELDPQPIYGVKRNGSLLWYKHAAQLSGEMSWYDPKNVGNDWHIFKHIFPGNAGVLYAVKPDGTLLWYKHDDWLDGDYAWYGPHDVGHSWGKFKHIFSGGYGIIYAIQPDGKLLWYRHDGWLNGKFAWTGPNVIGTGWHNFDHIFSGGNGIIYAVQPDGDLLWYCHKGHLQGSGEWDGPRQVGTGWAKFQHIFAARNGIIYAVEPFETSITNDIKDSKILSGGDLLWYRHNDYLTGGKAWVGPKKAGKNWAIAIIKSSGFKEIVIS